jgi:hypothetical protein
MELSRIPFGTTDWASRENRAQGRKRAGLLANPIVLGIRVRMVEYTPGYVADHWCIKGHVLLCVEGELTPSSRMADVRSSPG